MEVLYAVTELHQDAAAALLDDVVDRDAVGGHAVDLLGLERGDLSGGGAERRNLDPVRAPSLGTRQLHRQPIGQRARGRDADLLALEIIRALDRSVLEHDQHDGVRRVGERGHGLHWRALDDGGESRAAAERNVDAVGGQRLHHLGVAAEGANLDVKATLLEDAGLDTDVGRHEGELVGLGLADPQSCFRRLWRWPERGPQWRRGRQRLRAMLPTLFSPLPLVRLAALGFVLARDFALETDPSAFRSLRVAVSSSDMLPRTTTP